MRLFFTSLRLLRLPGSALSLAWVHSPRTPTRPNTFTARLPFGGEFSGFGRHSRWRYGTHARASIAVYSLDLRSSGHPSSALLSASSSLSLAGGSTNRFIRRPRSMTTPATPNQAPQRTAAGRHACCLRGCRAVPPPSLRLSRLAFPSHS